jgi:hypothetical protein
MAAAILTLASTAAAALPAPWPDRGVAWPARREEMKRILEHEEIGHMPPSQANVTAKESEAQTIAGGSVATVRLSFGPNGKVSLDVQLLKPAGNGPFPVIVFPSFETHGSADDVAKQFAAPVARGYAVATFFYQQCAADRPGARDSGFLPAYPDFDWGMIAATAWGMSRCVDYLQTLPDIDKSQVIAAGHSRLGKAALVAGAWDERFALTAPAGSGCGGTGAYRFCGVGRGGKEGLEDVVKRFPQWFVPQLATYSGRVEEMPFDQNWLIALVAPRRFIAADALDDPYANGNALGQAWLAAKPIYQALGVPERLAIHFRPGGHRMDPADWTAILDFADRELRGKTVDRRFDTLPDAVKLH